MKFNSEKGIVIAGHRGNPVKFTENDPESALKWRKNLN